MFAFASELDRDVAFSIKNEMYDVNINNLQSKKIWKVLMDFLKWSCILVMHMGCFGWSVLEVCCNFIFQINIFCIIADDFMHENLLKHEVGYSKLFNKIRLWHSNYMKDWIRKKS